jgi:xanthine/CO dehydrogenase XdhC/CoxF family maturation factor
MSDTAAADSAPPATAADSADPACDVAHGRAGVPASTRTLVAVFTSPVARFLLRYARDAGYRPVLVEPGAGHDDGPGPDGGPGPGGGPGPDGFTTAASLAGLADEATDVVVCDHHRPELGPVLRDALASPARWVGVLGNPRHPAPHIPALAALGVPDDEIARVHRPIGLNIGSRTPAEIALATMAGLIADRNGRSGGFEF